MRIFILEDSKERHIWFRNKLKDHDIDMVETAAEGVDLIQKNKYDRIFLDHDLGGDFMADSDVESNCGVTVAKALAHSINKDTQTIIHSWNPVGARKMHEILYYDGGNRDVTIAPFGSFTI